MLKLGIVYSNLLAPSFMGGGQVHALEVTKRLTKYFEVVHYPTSSTFRWPKEDLERKAKELESQGIKIANEFYEMLDRGYKYNLVGIRKFLLAEREARKFAKSLRPDVDFLYEPDHTSYEIFYLGSKIKFGFAIHEPLFYADSVQYLKRLWRFYRFNPSTGKGFYTRFLYNELVAKPRNRKLLEKYKPTFIASVSRGSLEWSGLRGEVIVPGNAFDKELLRYRNRGKEDYVVFWSRLNQDKGLPELPDILAKAERILGKKIKLVLMGKFFDKYNEKLFWRKVKKYGLNVEYLGFVPRERLNDVVSRAKLFIYPTHVDGFSLAVLESLALGTPVVAYGIPAIRTVYSGLSAVKIVEEFDQEGAAKIVAEILSMSEKELEDLMNEESLMKFLELHSDWDNVANAVKNLISKYAERKA